MPVHHGVSETERNIDKSADEQNVSGPCDFETAAKATKFGKFNYLLFLVMIPAQWAIVFEITTMSYVFPAAQCDLDLDLPKKGTLNAIVFAGMMLSGLGWGFICDVMGRKKLLVMGELVDGMFVIVSAFSQNYIMLLISKFFGGLIITGPFAALTSYMTEFHSNRYRSRVQLYRGFVMGLGDLALPSLAWAVMPRDMEYKSTYFAFHSWNVYLIACALPSLIASAAFFFMPESPKYLMTHGLNDKALDVFRLIYAMNTGEPKDTYPVTELEVEVKQNSSNTTVSTGPPTTKQAMVAGCTQLKTLFSRQHVKALIVVCGLLSFFMIDFTTLKFWCPQIFQSFNDHSAEHNGTSISLCSALKRLEKTNVHVLTEDCEVHLSGRVYANTMILAGVAMTGYLVAGAVIQKAGKKTLLGILVIFATIAAVGLYFCKSVAAVLATASILLAFTNIGINITLTITMEMFPTTLRAETVAFVLTIGRAASMISNLVFPYLLTFGCAPTVFCFAGIIFANVFLVLLLPSTENKALP